MINLDKFDSDCQVLSDRIATRIQAGSHDGESMADEYHRIKRVVAQELNTLREHLRWLEE